MVSVAVGIGAGLVSALLFAVVITGSPLAMLLSYLAPLPVFIAALGWRHHAGLIAAAAGAFALALALRLQVGAAFGLGVALPAWGIAYLALLGRVDERGQTEWYPLGRLMLWIVGTAALVALTGAVAIAGDYETYRSGMQRTLEAVLSGRAPGFPPPRLPAGLTPADVATTLAEWAPLVVGASFVPMLALNLWLAAKAVHLSGRLPRPWPYLPGMAMPREALALLAGAILVSILIGGFTGFFARALFGGLVSALLLNGLASMHQLSIGKPWRLGALTGVYLALLLGSTIIAPAIALFGLIDCLFRLRGNIVPPPTPPTPTTT